MFHLKYKAVLYLNCCQWTGLDVVAHLKSKTVLRQLHNKGFLCYIIAVKHYSMYWYPLSEIELMAA